VTTLLEQVAATIGGLDRVADGVGEGLLHHVVPVGSRLGGPVSKRATKAMDRYIALLHLLQHLWHGHVAKAGSRAGADETCEFPFSRYRPDNSSTALGDKVS
jgi:hypothetical protein